MLKRPAFVGLLLCAVAVVAGVLVLRGQRGAVIADDADSSQRRGARAAARLPYEASCAVLMKLGLLKEGPLPPRLDRMPRPDDEQLGVGFFRTEIAHARLDNLTLPRTYFGRSEIRDTSFRGTDLAESNLCWDDFERVDFGGASLRGADLRSSHFEHVSFDGADLSGADLRRSRLVDCSFQSTRLAGAKLTRAGGAALRLTSAQRGEIAWQPDDGPEPDGG